jgi:hypothetical protein
MPAMLFLLCKMLQRSSTGRQLPLKVHIFRSRDLFPQVVAAVAFSKPGVLRDALQPADIPEVPPGRLAYIDGYGNLKTTIRQDERQFGSGLRLRVRIGDITQEVVARDASFSVEPDQRESETLIIRFLGNGRL